jgi:DNA repair exonuclease SbcCD nuclease subunit
MASLKFVHAADLHLGRPFAGLNRSSPRLGELFVRAGYDAWKRIVDLSVDRKVDFVALAGDIFDGSRPSVRALVEFRNGIERLHAAEIPVFAALGNHDPLCDFPTTMHDLPGLSVFGSEPHGIELPRHPGVVVYGVSFESSAVTDNLARRFKRDPDADVAVGILHANVAGDPGHDNYSPCCLDDLKSTGMDVWCLGHVHAKNILNEEPLALYCGTSQGAHINETGACGCYLIDIQGSGPVTAEFVPVAPVRWGQVEVDVSEAEGPEDVVGVAVDAASNLVPDDDFLKALVVRIKLKGRPKAGVIGGQGGLAEIAESISEALENSSVPVFPESIRDLTRSWIDLNALRQDEGFLGEFLRRSRDLSGDPELVKELADAIAGELSKQSYGRYLTGTVSPSNLAENPGALSPLLEEAAELVADMFLVDSGS